MNLERINVVIGFIPFIVGVLVFGFLFFKHRKEQLTQPLLRTTTWWLFGFLVLFAVIKIATQYFVLLNDAFGKLLLPPHQSIAWFSYSVFAKHVAPLLLSLIAGACMYGMIKAVDRWYRTDMFMEHDGYLFLLAALVVGWPNFVLYVSLVFILTILYSLFSSITAKNFNESIVISQTLIFAIPLVLLFGNAIGQHFKIYLLTI